MLTAAKGIIISIGLGIATVVVFALFMPTTLGDYAQIDFMPRVTSTFEDRTWFHLEPGQCVLYPWEVNATRSDHRLTLEERKEAIKDYYEMHEISILGIVSSYPRLNPCEACGCSRGDAFEILVYKSDIPKIEENLAKETRRI